MDEAKFKEFEHDGEIYRIMKLNPMRQMFLAKHISVIVPVAMRILVRRALVAEKKPDTAEGAAAVLINMLDDVDEMAKVLHQLPDADFAQIAEECLSTMKRKAGEKWQDVWNHEGKFPQFDIDAFTIVLFMCKVVDYQLGNFTQRGLSAFNLDLLSPFTSPRASQTT